MGDIESIAPPEDRSDEVRSGMIWIPGGTFRMGSDRHYHEEAPVHRVTVDGFWNDQAPVTNREFRAFVAATGHVTVAEIPPDPNDYPGALPHMLRAGSLMFDPPNHPVDLALRYDRWKLLFLEQRAVGINVWQDPPVPLRLPKLIDLRGDSFERAPSDSGNYDTWRAERLFALVPAQDLVAGHLRTCVEFPLRQKPGSFSHDQVLAKMQETHSQ